MSKFLTDIGARTAVLVKEDEIYDLNGGRLVRTFTMKPQWVAQFLAGTLNPYTGSSAPLAFPARIIESSCENGVATLTLSYDFGIDQNGNTVDPTSSDLAVVYDVLSVEAYNKLSQIPYLKANPLSNFPDIPSATDANKLKNIRLRTLQRLLALPQSQRPAPGENWLPDFAEIVPGRSPAWDKFLALADGLPGAAPADTFAYESFVEVSTLEGTTPKTQRRYNFGRDHGAVTVDTLNDPWNLSLPISFLLGGDENETPATLQNGAGVAWDEWNVYKFAFLNGVEDLPRYDYVIRKTTTRSTAYAAQQSLVNVGKWTPHANILTELGTAAGALKWAFSADFAGTYWLKQAPEITVEANGNFKIRQDYLNAQNFSSYFYDTF